MCPLSVHESLSGSVMTNCSGGRVQLSLSLSHLQRRCQSYANKSINYSDNKNSENNNYKNINYSNKNLPVSPKNHTVTSFPRISTVSSAHSRDSAWSRALSRGARWVDALTQVGKLRVQCVFILFLVLTLQTQSAMCKDEGGSDIVEDLDKVTVKARFCQPVPVERLRQLRGYGYDTQGMPANSAKGQFGFQGDDPNAGLDLGDESDFLDDDEEDEEEESLLASSKMWLREEEIYANDRVYDGVVQRKDDVEYDLNAETDEKEDEEDDWEKGKGEDEEEEADGEDNLDHRPRHFPRRSWLPRRRILAPRRDEGRYGVSDVQNNDGKDSSNSDIFNKYNMRRRRRRRRSAAKTTQHKGTNVLGKDSRRKNNDKKADDGSLSNFNTKWLKKIDETTLDLILGKKIRLKNSAKRRKLRKLLRKEFRQRARKKNTPPPWHCVYKQFTTVLSGTTYPKVVNTGECPTTKCFHKLYKCEPNKIAIKILKREKGHCNPLPLIGNVTQYEERWNLETFYATVGCDCVSRAESSRMRRQKNHLYMFQKGLNQS